jgi:Fe-S cluster assembly ATPase SufC
MTALSPDAAGTGTVLVDEDVIEARDIVRSFGATPALRGASLRARRGEILAIMGPSGVGEVDTAALPGRHPDAGFRGDLVRREAS